MISHHFSCSLSGCSLPYIWGGRREGKVARLHVVLCCTLLRWKKMIIATNCHLLPVWLTMNNCNMNTITITTMIRLWVENIRWTDIKQSENFRQHVTGSIVCLWIRTVWSWGKLSEFGFNQSLFLSISPWRTHDIKGMMENNVFQPDHKNCRPSPLHSTYARNRLKQCEDLEFKLFGLQMSATESAVRLPSY